MKNYDLTVTLALILMIFVQLHSLSLEEYNEQTNHQFKIFTLLDTAKSYVLLNESIEETLSVC